MKRMHSLRSLSRCRSFIRSLLMWKALAMMSMKPTVRLANPVTTPSLPQKPMLPIMPCRIRKKPQLLAALFHGFRILSYPQLYLYRHSLWSDDPADTVVLRCAGCFVRACPPAHSTGPANRQFPFNLISITPIAEDKAVGAEYILPPSSTLFSHQV